jgi:uncharacterized phage protein (TIGR01671 family)
MRELKFRVWCKGTSTNANFNKPRWILPTDFILLKYYRCFQDVIESDDFVVQQYTGLKDKNGKEIYEGDIISGEFYDTEYHHSETIKHEVVFNNGAYNIASSNWHKPSLEIVGNIFENSEFLKQ